MLNWLMVASFVVFHILFWLGAIAFLIFLWIEWLDGRWERGVRNARV